MKDRVDTNVRMYGPLLDVLREMGGEAHRRELATIVADRVVPDPAERSATFAGGRNRAENEVHWALAYLGKAGLTEAAGKGAWRLTAAGRTRSLTLDEARTLRKEVWAIFKRESKTRAEAAVETVFEETVAPMDREVASLIDVIKSLPPAGFERLCRRILQRAGIEDVIVTGKSGDGGIDGTGVLRVNELVSFKVLFQCKRYADSVGSGSIRNFRGAMQGRTDKGIIFTTGYFTKDARDEAVRDGVPPIELVDGDALVSLMERLEIGVKPRTVYDVDDAFFEPFRKG